jgi:predicted PurR-regulated permease PerM
VLTVVNRRLFLSLTDKRAQRLLLGAALWLPALVVLVAVREVLLPFFLAAALAYVVLPPVRWLSSHEFAGRRLPRWLAVVLLYVFAVVVIVVGGRVFIPQLSKELTRLGQSASVAFQELSDDNITRKAVAVETWVEDSGLPIRIVTAEDEDGPVVVGNDTGGDHHPVLRIDVQQALRDALHRARAAALETAMDAASQVRVAVAFALHFMFSALLVLMLTAFIVADSDRVMSFIYALAPVRDRARLQDMLHRIDRGLSGVVRGQLTICIVNGILTLIGLLLLKVKFAFLLATVAAVFSLVPIFGSILSTIPIVVVALSSGVTTAVLAVLWIIGIHLLEANLLNPKIMGDAARIHPVLVVLALVVGEHYYGLAGALFAVPILSIAATVWKAALHRTYALDDEIVAHESMPPTVAGPEPEPATWSPSAPRRRLRADGG